MTPLQDTEAAREARRAAGQALLREARTALDGGPESIHDFLQRTAHLVSERRAAGPSRLRGQLQEAPPFPAPQTPAPVQPLENPSFLARLLTREARRVWERDHPSLFARITRVLARAYRALPSIPFFH